MIRFDLRQKVASPWAFNKFCVKTFVNFVIGVQGKPLTSLQLFIIIFHMNKVSQMENQFARMRMAKEFQCKFCF